jgi:hypothetical protein
MKLSGGQTYPGAEGTGSSVASPELPVGTDPIAAATRYSARSMTSPVRSAVSILAASGAGDGGR